MLRVRTNRIPGDSAPSAPRGRQEPQQTLPAPEEQKERTPSAHADQWGTHFSRLRRRAGTPVRQRLRRTRLPTGPAPAGGYPNEGRGTMAGRAPISRAMAAGLRCTWDSAVARAGRASRGLMLHGAWFEPHGVKYWGKNVAFSLRAFTAQSLRQGTAHSLTLVVCGGVAPRCLAAKRGRPAAWWGVLRPEGPGGGGVGRRQGGAATSTRCLPTF